MKKKTAAKTKRAKDPIDVRAAGFRDGLASARFQIAHQLHMCGLVELAGALEREDGFMFAWHAMKLRDACPAPKPAKVLGEDRQMSLLDWNGSATTSSKRARSRVASSR